MRSGCGVQRTPPPDERAGLNPCGPVPPWQFRASSAGRHAWRENHASIRAGSINHLLRRNKGVIRGARRTTSGRTNNRSKGTCLSLRPLLHLSICATITVALDNVTGDGSPGTADYFGRAMHYPRRNSKIKRARKMGFRARMRSHTGRKILNRKRRHGRQRVSVC